MNVRTLLLCFFTYMGEMGEEGGIEKHWRKAIEPLICSCFLLFYIFLRKTSLWSTGNNWLFSLFHKMRNECPVLQCCHCTAKTTHVEEIKSLHITSSPPCGWGRTKPEGDASLSTTASHYCFVVCKYISVRLLNLLIKAKCFWKQNCWQI